MEHQVLRAHQEHQAQVHRVLAEVQEHQVQVLQEHLVLQVLRERAVFHQQDR